MLEQNAFDFEDRLGVALCGMTRVDNFFRRNTIDMRAHVFDNTVSSLLRGSIAVNRDNRMGDDALRDRGSRQRFDETIVWVHVGDAGWHATERPEQHSLRLERHQLKTEFCEATGK